MSYDAVSGKRKGFRELGCRSVTGCWEMNESLRGERARESWSSCRGGKISQVRERIHCAIVKEMKVY